MSDQLSTQVVVQQDTQPSTQQDTEQNVQQDTEQNVQQDTQPNVQQDTQQDTQLSMQLNAHAIIENKHEKRSATATPQDKHATIQIVQVNVNQINNASVQHHPDLRVTQERIKEVEDNIDIILSGRPLTKLNILRVAISAMATTASMIDLPNSVKKMVLLAALNHTIEVECTKNTLSELDKEFLLTLVGEIVTQVIDLVHDVASKKIFVGPNSNCCVVL